jgi:hypothetical protein
LFFHLFARNPGYTFDGCYWGERPPGAGIHSVLSEAAAGTADCLGLDSEHGVGRTELAARPWARPQLFGP